MKKCLLILFFIFLVALAQQQLKSELAKAQTNEDPNLQIACSKICLQDAYKIDKCNASGIIEELINESEKESSKH